MRLTEIFKRPLVISATEQKREELERVLALAGAAEHPIFKAVVSYADEHARNEHETALAPNLTNEQRQFNAGRSAAAYDWAIALRQIQAAAEAKANKLKAED
jgi:hypothetical protein